MRFHGLDFIRFTAIIIVLLYHTEFLFEGHLEFSFLTKVPVYGSDVFFVISGFLIGLGLLRFLDRKNGDFNLKDLIEFYLRRIVKIFPSYYFVLLLNIILVYFSLIPGEINRNILAFFPLLQNFFKPYDNLMWESWSLTIEHWYYLFFPSLVLLTTVLFKSKINANSKYILVALLFVVVPTLLRYFSNSGVSWEFQYWDLHVRKMVLMRFDSIGYGILSAYFFVQYQIKWKKYRYFLFCFGIMVLTSILYFPPEKNNQLSSTFGLSIIPIGLSLMIPLLTTTSFGFLNKPLQFISERTYSIYLLHIPLAHTLSSLYEPSNLVDIYLRFVVYWFFLVLMTHLLYNWIEKPVMNNRSYMIKRVFEILNLSQESREN